MEGRGKERGWRDKWKREETWTFKKDEPAT